MRLCWTCALSATAVLPLLISPMTPGAYAAASEARTPGVEAAGREPQEADAYTRYELGEPGSGRFRIFYDVSAIRPGAKAYFNPIRRGSIASEETVTDASTGAPLRFSVISGADARAAGLQDADLRLDYIKIELARPVPGGGGQSRLHIVKTYEDRESYTSDNGEIAFTRSLGVKRNAVVLPKGYALISSNFPSQVEEEADGRLKVSFINPTPAEAPLRITARPAAFSAAPSSVAGRIMERARQTRDIVYFLRDPETHAFDLYHDYTEDRAGVARYVNVVRPGSAASNPSAVNLDTGAVVPARILKGAEIEAAGVSDPALPTITPASEVVVFTFPTLAPNQSVRLRMSETYVDPGRYRLVGDELVFERSLGRPANAVVLPKGFVLTNSTAPATLSALKDGRERLDFINPRNDDLEVVITARRLTPP